MTRLAVVVSHPIQYYSPWFVQLASEPDLQLHVFYLWDFGIKQQQDPGFGMNLTWDLPLLEGYPSKLLPNAATVPGSHHFFGLDNPTLVSELLAWQPDVLLLFGYTYRSHLRLLLDPRLWKLPILFRGDSHLLCPRHDWRFRLSLLLRRVLFQRFSAALAVGQANRIWLQASGFSAEQIVLAPHAVDNDRFRGAASRAAADAKNWRHELGIAEDALVVLFAGKFEPKKNPLDLLEAFVALRHPSAVLVLVGSGALDQQLRHAATKTDRQVWILPFQNQSVMPRVYALADLVVLPSSGPSETWGLCINEAMNLAKPVIVSSHVGCGPDLVISAKTGWVFPAGDRHALQERLGVALADPARLKTMGLAAQQHVNKYNYAASTSGLLRALSLVLKNSL